MSADGHPLRRQQQPQQQSVSDLTAAEVTPGTTDSTQPPSLSSAEEVTPVSSPKQRSLSFVPLPQRKKKVSVDTAHEAGGTSSTSHRPSLTSFFKRTSPAQSSRLRQLRSSLPREFSNDSSFSDLRQLEDASTRGTSAVDKDGDELEEKRSGSLRKSDSKLSPAHVVVQAEVAAFPTIDQSTSPSAEKQQPQPQSHHHHHNHRRRRSVKKAIPSAKPKSIAVKPAFDSSDDDGMTMFRDSSDQLFGGGSVGDMGKFRKSEAPEARSSHTESWRPRNFGFGGMRTNEPSPAHVDGRLADQVNEDLEEYGQRSSEVSAFEIYCRYLGMIMGSYFAIYSSNYVVRRQSSSLIFKSQLSAALLHFFPFLWLLDLLTMFDLSKSDCNMSRLTVYVIITVEVCSTSLLFLFLKRLNHRRQFVFQRILVILLLFAAISWRGIIYCDVSFHQEWHVLVGPIAIMLCTLRIGTIVMIMCMAESVLTFYFRNVLCSTCRFQDPSIYHVLNSVVNIVITHLFFFGATAATQSFAAKTLYNLKKTLFKFKHVNQQLSKARDHAVKSNDVKSRFLSNISHELRTPLNGILGCCEELKQVEMDETAAQNLGALIYSAENLQSLISDMLTYSKLDAGDMDLEEIPFSVPDVIESVVNSLAPIANGHGLELILEMHVFCPLIVLGDSVQFAQMIRNLLVNAIKFTPKGEIKVGLRVSGETESYVKLFVSVEDTGIGVARDKVDAIFGAFVLADESNSRQHGGAGLGLAIVKKLARLQRGNIWVESDGHSGSKFQFTARLKKSDTDKGAKAMADSMYRIWWPPSITIPDLGSAEEEKHMSPRSPLTELKDIKVLVVEDNASSRSNIFSLCSRLGMNPHEARSREDALRQIVEASANGFPFHMILLDFTLPQSKMTQLEFLEKIQEAGSDFAGAKGLKRIVLMKYSDFAADLVNQRRGSGVRRNLKSRKSSNPNLSAIPDSVLSQMMSPSLSPRRSERDRQDKSSSPVPLPVNSPLSRPSPSSANSGAILTDPALRILSKPVTLPKLGSVAIEVVHAFKHESQRRRNRKSSIPNLPRLRILVVDDNPINLRLCCSQVARLGHDPVPVTGGLEAIEAVFESPFDVVLMDIYMPGVSGLEATKAIRQRATELQMRQIPIIAITANSTGNDKNQCFRAGMNGFVSKPVSPQKLEAIIQKAYFQTADSDAEDTREAPQNSSISS